MIYFDNAATTPPIASVQDEYFNPSSPHALGIMAERALKDARNTIADVLSNNVETVSSPHPSRPHRSILVDGGGLSSITPSEIVFTSGGTESNNLAIMGYALAHMKQGVTLISNTYEHPSILAPMQFAAERGWACVSHDFTQIPPGKVLVSISQVNHETGDINNINAIAREIKTKNPAAVIHVDGVQGFCKEFISLENIDMFSFSSHKCHGPTGVGGLWVKKGIRLTPLLHGGGQEDNRRPGTENVDSIVKMATIAKHMYDNLNTYYTHVKAIKNALMQTQEILPDTHINRLCSDVSPYILNMSFVGVKGEIVVNALSDKGIYVSMGAACHSRKNAKPALSLMGFAPEIAESAVRFSFSHFNTVEEAEIVRDTVARLVTQFRKVL